MGLGGLLIVMPAARASEPLIGLVYFSGGLGGYLAGLYFEVPVMTWTLVGLMIIDIICGLSAAWISGEINSDASYHGMVRKTLILLLVLACAIVSRVLPDDFRVPAGTISSSFFCAHEFISIVENVKRAGVAPPEILKDLFERVSRKGIAKPGADD